MAVYAAHLGASPFVLGLLMALFSFAPSLLTVPLGRLIDRIGSRWPLPVAHVVMALAALMLYIWPRMELLYVLASLMGTAFFSVYLSANTLIGRLGPERRAANFSLMSTGIAAAQGVAPLMLGFCADHVGYPEAFALVAVYAFLCQAAFVFCRIPHLEPGQKVAGGQAKKGGTMELLRDPGLRPVFIVSTLFILGWDVFLVMTPIYGTQLGLSASQMGMLMSAYAVASILVRFMGGTLARWYTPWQVLLAALVVASAGTFAFGSVSTMPLLLLWAFVMGLGQGIGSPMSTTAVYDAAPPERVTEASGVRLSLGMAAQTGLPLIVGSMGAVLPAAVIFWASGVLLAGGAWMERRQWRAARPKQPA